MKKFIAVLMALALAMSCAAFAENDSRADAYGYALNYFSNQEFDKASIQFSRVGDYADAKEYIDYIAVIKLGLDGMYAPAAATIANLYSNLQDAADYQIYFSALDQLDKGEYETAEANLLSLNGFFNSIELLDEMNDRYNQSVYDEAAAAMAAGNWDTALEIYSMLDDRAMMKECWYQRAQALASAGKYAEAAEQYGSIIGYKDAADQYIRMQAQLSVNNSYAVGSTVTLGQYPISVQKNGDSWTITSAPIEWTVLAVEDGKALLITKNAIDSQIYGSLGEVSEEESDEPLTLVTWSASSLRAWLNSDFYAAAFTEQEASLILATSVKAERNPQFPVGPGVDTVDKVFILSMSELNKYFKNNEARLCKATDYAVRMRSAGVNDAGYCWYWVRNPGKNAQFAAVVLRDGSLSYNGRMANDMYVSVRPAMWISIY